MQTKREIIVAKLKELEISFDGRMSDNKLWDLLPEDARPEVKEAMLALEEEQKKAAEASVVEPTTDQGDDEEAIATPSGDAINTDPVPAAGQDPQPQPKVQMKGNLRLDGKLYEKDRWYSVSEVIKKKMEELGLV